MLLTTEALPPRLTTTSYERSLEAARKHELNSAIRRQHQQRDPKRTDLHRLLAVRRPA
ncbi:hypothetical protein GCM10011575_35960 [Microlunatus endophyticus]|uniref:Uncharacterized protein n=1 Tax=Microlunatus endophyticus TaxID=1716077 RepID=A0A917SEZ2_9ACTN|nr:hypothetical protein [Microlunatus endophyticus]GGL74528.1 hypothetical protein GCM10011575_35960 [Microlunatus endophyticus]